MPLVIRWGGEDYTCREQVPIELLKAVEVELGVRSGRPAEDVDNFLRLSAALRDFVSGALRPESAHRFRQACRGASMDRVVELSKAIAGRVDVRSGRIRG